jgi:hypothetical protein
MGLPQAQDMDGAPLRLAFDAGLLERHPPARIASYETAAAAQAAAGGGEVDEQVMEDLRALGYIKAQGK